ncbi:MAG TPA: hypothetical protein QF359_11895, partial [Rhodospirillales bacterium]|nr:hypothetical protein [Rhodospirillales bacterium]
VLFAHPDIQEAAAVGVIDKYSGEAIQAFVVLADGVNPTSEELIDYCQGKLAKFKVPSEIHIIELLPKTPAAKIDKLALKKSLEQD